MKRNALHSALFERKDETGGDGAANSAVVTEIKGLIEAQGRAWEQFKAANDERLAKLAKGEAVGEIEAKLAKLNEELTRVSDEAKELAKKANRPQLDDKGATETAREIKSFNRSLTAHSMRLNRQMPEAMNADNYAGYKSGFRLYLRKGDQQFGDAERKAINVGTDPEGGYLVDEEMEAGIDRVAVKYSAMRTIARVITIGAASYERLVKTSGASAGGWGGETTAPSETGTPMFVKQEYVPGLLWAEPRMTSQSLEDSVYDLEADLMEEIGITFADQEATAFISGSGVNQPRGLLSYTTVANASYAWGKLGYIASGAPSAFASSDPSDALIDLQHALRRNYRTGAQWYMNDATLGTIRKFKDGQGNYLWAPSGLQNGIVGQLLGYGVVSDDYMQDIGANNYPVAFGDFNAGYLIVDRRGITVLRDPYTAKPYIKFFATKRVTGGVRNYEAIKLLKIASS